MKLSNLFSPQLMKLSNLFSTMYEPFLLLLLFSNLLFIASCSPLCHDRERVSLLTFKQSFSIDKSASSELGYPKTDSWGREPSECCLWDGVECNNDTGHVVGLDLSSSFLYGSIDSNSSLFELVHLQSLSLADNHFNYSQIPSSFNLLSNLTYLNLFFSVFAGQIPSEISQLSKLTYLNLSCNTDPTNIENKLLRLKSPGFETLIRNLTSLEQLHLSYVDISSTLPRSLANLTSLASLFLKKCDLTGEFPVSIFHMPNLESLSVRFNTFLSGRLPSFNHSNSLKFLPLSGTNFSGELPSSIEQHRSLAFLDVSDCKFSGSIPSSLGNLNQLVYLDLSNNKFRGNIPSSLRNLTQLTYLSLSNNDFSNGTFPFVSSLSKLIHLDLEDSSLIGSVPSSFSNLTNLEFISLEYNDLTVDFNIFLSFKNLTSLLVSTNTLEGVTEQTTNRSLPQLKYLVIRFCNLKTFPNFLRYQQRIKWLDLGGNQIGGQIPKWLLNISLETLMLIDLGNNLLTGFEQSPSSLPWLNLHVLLLHQNMLNSALPIPPKSTIVYDVSYNKFTGPLSPLICNAHSLLILDLSSNQLDGELPQCLGNFSNSLSSLSLDENYFSGHIPQTFLKSSQLRKLDLSNNQLEGKLPQSLANCAMLEYLSVENNLLDDVFPFWLGSLPGLRVLALGNNTFHGNIGDPLTDFEFPNLRIIDLSYNSFTGNLPSKYLDSWKVMKNSSTGNPGYMESIGRTSEGDYTFTYSYSITITIKGVGRLYMRIQNALAVIDLSNNKFNGQVPEVIGSLKGLISLDLSNNDLTGDIPSSLGDLSELESLDLSRNMLTGDIPQELTKLNFLQYFNVSNNGLTGPIPQENQLSRFESSSYEGNLGLCGFPLPNKCGDPSKDSSEPELVQPSSGSDDEWLNFGWKAVAIGYACGFVVGVFLGAAVLSRRPRWFSMIYRVRI